MAELNKIVRFLNKELKINKIKDSSKNGLQVKGKKDVRKIGFAVDACLSTFEKAKKAKVDLLIVHHGLKWKKNKYKELAKRGEQFLKKNNISLYGVHLPLDAHSKYGNNIELAKILNLKNIKKFGSYHRFKIGYSGLFKKPAALNKIANILNKSLKTKCNVLPFGKKHIKSIGIVSGGGLDSIEEAVKSKLDCFLTGDMVLSAYLRIKDYNLNVIAGGHYATETVGVKALMPLINERFKVQTAFIDNKVNL